MRYARLVTHLTLLATVVFSVTSFSIAANQQPPQRASEILRSVDDLWRGSSSHAVTTMRVKTRRYTRTMRLEGWSNRAIGLKINQLHLLTL